MDSASEGTVTELFDAHPVEDRMWEIQRDEEYLLNSPTEPGPIKMQDHEPLQVVHSPITWLPTKIATPQGVHESDHFRLEWQLMGDFRQPFYHRNVDVDGLSYQIVGERTLMTELGTLQLQPGGFQRILVDMAHDNYGSASLHLLCYIPAPVAECKPVRLSRCLHTTFTAVFFVPTLKFTPSYYQ